MQGLIELLRENWAWVAGVVVATAALVKLLLSQRFALRAETVAAHATLSNQVADIEERMDAMETWKAVTMERLRHLPTVEDFRRLENSVGAVTASIEKLTARSEATQHSVTGVQEQLQNLTQHLLSTGR